MNVELNFSEKAIQKIHTDACRAINRLMHERTKGWLEDEKVDAHFDGGEWSGPSWGEQWEAMETRCIHDVAVHYNIEDVELTHLYECYTHEEDVNYVQAQPEMEKHHD